MLGSCTDLPPIGAVDLNLDSQRRWGTRKGSTVYRCQIANCGLRKIAAAGLLRSQVPWVVLTTQPKGDANPGRVSDLFLWQQGRWAHSSTAHPAQSIWQLWTAATSRADSDGIVAVEIPDLTFHYPVRSVPWSLRLWELGGTTRKVPLTRIPIAQDSFKRPLEMASFDDGSTVIVGSNEKLQLLVERFTLDAGRSILATFPEVKLPRMPPGDHPQFSRRTAAWNVEFLAARSFVLWRADTPALRFDWDEAKGAFGHTPLSKPPRAQSIVTAMLRAPIDKVWGVYPLPSGETLVMARRGTEWLVLSDRPVTKPCPPPPEPGQATAR